MIKYYYVRSFRINHYLSLSIDPRRSRWNLQITVCQPIEIWGPSQYRLQHVLCCNDDSCNSRPDSRNWKGRWENLPFSLTDSQRPRYPAMWGRGVEDWISTQGFPIKHLGLSYAGDVSGMEHDLTISPRPLSSYRTTLSLFYNLVINNSHAL